MKTEKVDELIRLKAEEEPPEEYWNNYLSRLENRMERTSATSQLNSSLQRGNTRNSSQS